MDVRSLPSGDRRRMLASLLALVLLLPLQSLETVQPHTDSSPAGDWTLFVDPSSITGAGPSHVVVTRDVRTAAPRKAWEADLPFTLCEAVITDAGYAAGYAWTADYRGIAGNGEFVVAI